MLLFCDEVFIVDIVIGGRFTCLALLVTFWPEMFDCEL